MYKFVPFRSVLVFTLVCFSLLLASAHLWSDKMENKSEFRQWDELIPDALGLIFTSLSLEEKLMVVPRVCKSWAKVINGPYCWQEIDIEDWSNRSNSEEVDRMVRNLVTRSCGSLKMLCVSELESESLIFVLDNARHLNTLRLPRSLISDSFTEQIAPRLSLITSLDLSYCSKLGASALESIGKHCKSLTWLRRNMHPIIDRLGKISQDDEAHAIATSMRTLKKLELAYMLVNTGAVLEIMYNCPSLESLDLRGCWEVKIEEKFVKEKFPGLKILGPHVVDYFEKENSWEVCSDYSESFYDSDSFDGMWGDDESLELTFYAGFGENAGYGWPTSP